MNSILLLSGIQGCGKTTVADRLSTVYGMTVADMGTLMFEELASEYSLSNRDQIRSLPSPPLIRAFNSSLAEFARRETRKPKVLVTHLLPRRLGEMYFPQHLDPGNNCNISGIILLVSEPREIFHRRLLDRLRKRAPADVNLLHVEQCRYLIMALIVASNLGVPVAVVLNPERGIDQAAHVISVLAQKLFDGGKKC